MPTAQTHAPADETFIRKASRPPCTVTARPPQSAPGVSTPVTTTPPSGASAMSEGRSAPLPLSTVTQTSPPLVAYLATEMSAAPTEVRTVAAVDGSKSTDPWK